MFKFRIEKPNVIKPKKLTHFLSLSENLKNLKQVRN